MKELIDFSDICVSPHREPYEKFLQFDRLRSRQDYDKNIGLYGRLSTIFPISYHPAIEAPSRDIWLFPSKGGKKRPFTKEEVEQSVFSPFPENQNLYAFKKIRIPGEKETLVKPGNPIFPEHVKRIAEHNKSALKDNGPEPLRKITILVLEDEEKPVVASLNNQDDFDPQQLEREKEITIELKDYRIDLPLSPKSINDPDAFPRELDALEWVCRNRGETLRMAVGLTLNIKEKTILSYKGAKHEMPERKRNRKSLFGYFPIFTERHTFIINGQERVPVTQLLPRPGLHLTREGEEDPTVENHLNASIRPQRGPFFEIGLPGNNVDGSESIYVRIGKHST